MDYRVSFKKSNGFSLMELIIVMGIIAIVSVVSFSAYNAFKASSSTDMVATEIVDLLRYTQTNSEAAKEDSSWGLKIKSENVVIFSGESYAERNKNFDRVVRLSSKISIDGIDEVIFKKLTGFTSDTEILFSIGEKEKSININEKGNIEH